MCMKKVDKFKITCSTCKRTFELTASKAKKIASKHDGFIPCEHCGSHATQWDTAKLK